MKGPISSQTYPLNFKGCIGWFSSVVVKIPEPKTTYRRKCLFWPKPAERDGIQWRRDGAGDKKDIHI